jgi:hypothetical protein
MTESVDESTPNQPPGPKLLAPWYGAHFIWSRPQVLHKCARRYGDVFSLTVPVFGQVIVGADPTSAKALFTAAASRGAAYRPQSQDATVFVPAGSGSAPGYPASRSAQAGPSHPRRLPLTAARGGVAGRGLQPWPAAAGSSLLATARGAGLPATRGRPTQDLIPHSFTGFHTRLRRGDLFVDCKV